MEKKLVEKGIETKEMVEQEIAPEAQRLKNSIRENGGRTNGLIKNCGRENSGKTKGSRDNGDRKNSGR